MMPGTLFDRLNTVKEPDLDNTSGGKQ